MKILESLFGKLLLTGLACCCFSWVKADTKPFFTTGIDISQNGEMWLAEKGKKCVDIFSADGKKLLHSYPVDETPTGILLHEGKAYVTTFETMGHLQIMQMETGKVEKIIPTGSGACTDE